MKQNQNSRQNRQSRSGQSNKHHQHNNQKRGGGKARQNNQTQHPNSPTRQVDSRGPAGNLRGTAAQLFEKYKILAQDKRASDRLESESLSQHADHYYRIYAEIAAADAASQVARDKEMAKKAQEEAERRANAKPIEPQKQEATRPKQEAKTDSAKDVTPLKLDLDVPKKKHSEKKPIEKKPKEPEKTSQESSADMTPTKRRGRPAKISATSPEEKNAATDAEA